MLPGSISSQDNSTASFLGHKEIYTLPLWVQSLLDKVRFLALLLAKLDHNKRIAEAVRVGGWKAPGTADMETKNFLLPEVHKLE